MTTQFWCLLIGVLLPYVWAGASLPFRKQQFGSPDLNEPRVQGEQLTGAGARAWGAQMNAWEAIIVFGAANFAAFAAGVEPTGSWSIAAMIWVAARAAHGAAYVAGVTPVRVLAFVTGSGMSLWIFGIALSA
jgi:uncharacterized MAPEG superfamily protein